MCVRAGNIIWFYLNNNFVPIRCSHKFFGCFRSPGWFSYTVVLRGTLQEVPFFASTRYGWKIRKFEWKFLAMSGTLNNEKGEIPNPMTNNDKAKESDPFGKFAFRSSSTSISLTILCLPACLCTLIILSFVN